MAECIARLRVCQGAGERQDYAFDLTREFAKLWQRDAPFTSGVAVRPNSRPGRGLEYLSSGGVSAGGEEPRWPGAVGDAIADGPILWTAQAISNTSLRHRISTVVWSAPAGITASDQVETDDPALQEARVFVSGGEAGTTYDILGTVTTISGAVYEVLLRVSVV